MKRIMKQNCFDYDIRVSFFIFSSSVCCFCFFSLYCAPSTALNAFVGSGYCAIVCEAQLLRLVRFFRAFTYNWLCHSAVSPLTASPHYIRLNTFSLTLCVFVCSSHTVLIVRTSTRSENIWYTFMFENWATKERKLLFCSLLYVFMLLYMSL